MRKHLLLIVVASLAVGCMPKPPATTIMPRGEEMQPLHGWVEYCQRHPEDQSCPTQPK